MTYFVLAYLISWIIWLPLYSSVLNIPELPVLPCNHALGGLGPMMSAIITTRLYLGKRGVRSLMFGCFKIRPFGYLLVALSGPFLLAFLALIVKSILNGGPLSFSGGFVAREFPSSGIASLFLYNLLFFGFGEETGWRGFALPRLQYRFRALMAGVVLAIFWAIWHIPLFFYRPGYTELSVPGIIGWFFSLLTGSVLTAWLYNSSKGSTLICAVFHSTIDIVFTVDYADKDLSGIIGFLVMLWGIAVVIIYKPRNLSGIKRQKYLHQ